MEKEKFYKIIKFNDERTRDIKIATTSFYEMLGRDEAFVILDIQTVAKTLFMQKQYQLVHIPLASSEICAYQLRLNRKKYLVINTNKSLANNNFAVAHEIYHLLIDFHDSTDGDEVYLDKYEEDETEMLANAFAGNVLMPREDFVLSATMLKNTFDKAAKSNTEYEKIIALILGLMAYYKTTYMSIVIRLFEVGIFGVDNSKLVNYLLKNNDEESLQKIFDELAALVGASSIMKATKEDDFGVLLSEAEEKGREAKEKGLITDEDLEYRIEGMSKAYQRVKEL
ncbi:ImmA/IrrE family metallo-endopeptidase [Butyrivibrio proteoclasticus]|uniref:ImmA/IrrE family metallo-endopeptidase n=1 Tax=Butyrivibrio proteoclasticus TaxID=43305 RepID=UPI0004788117|nr:ImmA/IrrE family metallo-endopeptidase [Butyrivibrio proteoclasticus]